VDGGVEFEARSISGSYRGKVNAAGEIAGEWVQQAFHAPLTFRRAAKP
jgi:hypothetical protein